MVQVVDILSGLLNWFVGQVWPNLFASMLCFGVGILFARWKFVRPLHDRIEGVHSHIDEIHDRLDQQDAVLAQQSSGGHAATETFPTVE